MTVLIGIALKSLLIAGLTLGLLRIMKSRSAAERSWVAHIGLLSLVIMAFAPLVLPAWNVEILPCSLRRWKRRSRSRAFRWSLRCRTSRP